MKIFYKRFDYFLNLLLVGTIIASIPEYYLTAITTNSADNALYQFKMAIIPALFITSLFFGLIYILLGVILLISAAKTKNLAKKNDAKKLMIKGLVRCIVVIIYIFFVSLLLNYFGYVGNGDVTNLTLPSIPTESN